MSESGPNRYEALADGRPSYGCQLAFRVAVARLGHRVDSQENALGFYRTAA